MRRLGAPAVVAPRVLAVGGVDYLLASVEEIGVSGVVGGAEQIGVTETP